MLSPSPTPQPQRRLPVAGGRTPARGRDLDARTLYLVPADTVKVSSTGEALVATRTDGEVRRLPVARLLRVVCNDRVHWSGAALALCQTRGITVTWLDGRGNALGHLWPDRAPQTDLSDALDALAGSPGDWPSLYANWLRRQRLTVLHIWKDQRARAGWPVTEDEWNCAKRAWVYRNEAAEHLPPVLHGMVAALVASRLAGDGLLPDYWCADGSRISLAADLAQLVWAELNFVGGALAEALHDQRNAAAMFERWSVRCADMLQLHLASLKAQAMRQLRGR